ncbi:MAG TPA: nuclear transport factor 2 family protein [Acidimicrobiales bacterium]
MYKAAVRALVRRQLRQLNAGDYGPILQMAAPDAELAFPGDNSWARQFRPQDKGRAQHTTHRGHDELEGFARRFVDAGLQLEVEDILVNGPPWNTRLCVRATDASADGAYVNRVCALIELRWGRIHRWEDYLDTERVAAWDRTVGADTAGTTAVPA